MPKFRLLFFFGTPYCIRLKEYMKSTCIVQKPQTSTVNIKQSWKGNSQRARAEKAAGGVTSARGSVHQAPRYKGCSISNSLITLFLASFKERKEKWMHLSSNNLNQKVALDMEIAVFRRLLETEEDRLGIEGRSGHWSCSVRKWTFWNFKCRIYVKGLKLNCFVNFK